MLSDYSDVLIPLSSGFIGVIVGIFVSALAASFERQKQEIKRTLLIAEHTFSNLNICLHQIGIPLRNILHKSFGEHSNGKRVNLSQLGSLNTSLTTNIQRLNTEDDTIAVRFLMFSISPTEKINRSNRVISDLVNTFESQVHALRYIDYPKKVLSDNERQALLDTLFAIWGCLNDEQQFLRMLIFSYQDSLSQRPTRFTFAKLYYSKTVKLVKAQFELTYSMLADLEDVLLTSKKVLSQYDAYKDYFEKG